MKHYGYTIEVTRKLDVDSQDIDDIMAVALEGGINYWCKQAEVVGEYKGEFASEQISQNGALLLYDREDEAVYELTLEKFLDGLTKAIEHCWFWDYGWCDGKEINTGNVDAELADVIIQLAIFEDVIYG